MNKETLRALQRLVFLVDKHSRKELDAIALTFGIDTKPYLNTMWGGMGIRKDNYSNMTKTDVAKTIVIEELKRLKK